jgi:hypothetical protein
MHRLRGLSQLDLLSEASFHCYQDLEPTGICPPSRQCDDGATTSVTTLGRCGSCGLGQKTDRIGAVGF